MCLYLTSRQQSRLHQDLQCDSQTSDKEQNTSFPVWSRIHISCLIKYYTETLRSYTVHTLLCNRNMSDNINIIPQLLERVKTPISGEVCSVVSLWLEAHSRDGVVLTAASLRKITTVHEMTKDRPEITHFLKIYLFLTSLLHVVIFSNPPPHLPKD